MEKYKLIFLALVPVTVVLSFFVHWLTIRQIKTPEERLPFCRGAYLSMSFQLVLYSWIIYSVLDSVSAAVLLIPLGMTFSFSGDIFNLQFTPITEKIKEPVFFGIISFVLAQFCYIGAFLTMVPLSELVSNGYFYYILAVFLIVPALLFRLRVYNAERPMTIMKGAFIYGFILGAMAAITLSAAIARGGYWYIVATGALFFLLSDAVMGETTIYGRHPRFEYQVPWITYITAQGLIILGSAAFSI